MKNVLSKLNAGLLIILFGMMCLCSTKTNATCQAGFTWAQNANNVVSFTNTSTGTTNQTYYSWQFGDANWGYGANPGPHTYLDSGTYVVCLTLSDSLNTCNSTTCDTIHVYGVLICNMSVTFSSSPASCNTCADGSATAYPTGGTSPYSYLWSPGGATTQSINNMLPGLYIVLITDANNCSDSTSTTIDTCSLHASYTWTQPSNNVISFTNTSTGTNGNTQYLWDFGDGNYDYNSYPSPHTYYSAGTYVVCLILSDSLNFSSCQSSICDTITVTGVNCNNLGDSLSGWDASCNTCTDGWAVAHPYGGTAPYTFSWSPSGGTNATATGLHSGMYYCFVTDSNGCNVYNSVFIGPDSCSAFFTIVPDTNNIAHTYWAVNYATGAQPLTYNWTWGDSSMPDSMPYPSHTYSQAGFYTICLNITDANGCQSSYCDSSYLQRNANTIIYVNVINPLTLGINNIESLSNWAVYPNPVSNSMTINYALSHSTNVMINVYDMLGNRVGEVVNERESTGQHAILWNAATVPQGIYLMQIRTDDKVINQKITVIK
jgi:PKD repeat protein